MSSHLADHFDRFKSVTWESQRVAPLVAEDYDISHRQAECGNHSLYSAERGLTLPFY